MQISVDDLRTLADMLLTHLEQTGYRVIDVDSDYYWTVPEDVRYDNYKQPQELGVGQLTDNWAELRKVLRGEKPLLNYDLVGLAAILRRIGECANEAGPGKIAGSESQSGEKEKR